MATSSPSERHRKAGNDHFFTAIEKIDSGPLEAVDWFKKALLEYNDALIHASSEKEAMSAHKNAFSGHVRIVQLLFTKAEKPSFLAELNYYCRQAVCEFGSVNRFCGMDDSGIRADLDERFLRFFMKLIDLCAVCFIGKRDENIHFLRRFLRTMQEVLGNIPLPGVQYAIAQCQFRVATLLFHEALRFEETKRYQKAWYLLMEVEQPIEEAVTRDSQMLEQAMELRESVRFHMACVDSMRQIAIADQMINDASFESEELNVDLLWLAIDRLRDAIILSRGIFIEGELIATSKMGTCFWRVLRMRDRARICHVNAFHLSEALSPRNFDGEEWYRLSKEDLQALRKLDEEEERERNQKEFQEAREKIAPQLKKLNEMVKEGYAKFAAFVYETHPPVSKADCPVIEEAKDAKGKIEAQKKAMKRSMIHYHTDKYQSLKSTNVEQFLILEEVSKLLGALWQEMKGMGGDDGEVPTE